MHAHNSANIERKPSHTGLHCASMRTLGESQQRLLRSSSSSWGTGCDKPEQKIWAQHEPRVLVKASRDRRAAVGFLFKALQHRTVLALDML